MELFRAGWALIVKQCFLFFVLLGVLLFSMNMAKADSNDMPPNWPWHGVNIAAPAGGNEDLVKYKRELNINMVRLHFLGYYFRNMSNEAVINASFQWLDPILDECQKLGITAVINLDFFPLGEAADIRNTPQFWNDPKYKRQILEMTRMFAVHFKTRGAELAAYDILSEPLVYVDGHAQQPEKWVELQTQIFQTVREVDASRWVVFAPGPGGGPEGYANYFPPVAERVIWGVHIYIPHAFTHQGIYNYPLGVTYPGVIHSDMWDKKLLKAAFKPLINFQRHHKGPVWVGEFSAVRWANGGGQYLRDVTDIFNENEWGWSYFSGADWHGWQPDFDGEFSTDQDFEKHRVGMKSERWRVLKEIFNK